MIILVVSHKNFFAVNGGHYARGGTPLEYNTLREVFEHVHILVNVQKAECPPPGTTRLDRRIQVHRIAKRSYSRAFLRQLLTLKAALQTAWLVRRNRIDLVIGKAPGEIGMGGVIGARLANTPSVLRLTADWFSDFYLGSLRVNSQRSWLTLQYRKAMLRLAARACDRILPISESIANRVIGLGVPKERVAKPLFEPSVTQAYFDVPPLSAGTNDKMFVYVGRLVSVKNVERLLEAFRILLDRLNSRSRPKLRIVGDGYLRQPLERECEELHLTESVEFVGQVPLSEVLKHLVNAWALVLPSLSEGFGKVVAEAMAAARPVAASRVGAIPYLVEDGVTGYLFDPGDAADIAEKLEWLLSDEAKAIKMGIAARDRARAWDLGTFKRRIHELAIEIASRSGERYTP